MRVVRSTFVGLAILVAVVMLPLYGQWKRYDTGSAGNFVLCDSSGRCASLETTGTAGVYALRIVGGSSGGGGGTVAQGAAGATAWPMTLSGVTVTIPVNVTNPSFAVTESGAWGVTASQGGNWSITNTGFAVNGGTVTATPTGTTTVAGTLTGVTGTFQANAGTGTFNDTFTNTAIQANQGTAANATAGWPTISGVVTATTAALTSASPLDSTIGVSTKGYGTVLITLNPSGTITGGTYLFEASDDGGATYNHVLQCIRGDVAPAGVFTSLGASTVKSWTTCPTRGFTNVRARLNPQFTNSGTSNIAMQAANFSHDPFVAAYLQAGGNTVGAVKTLGKTSTSNAPTATADGSDSQIMTDKHGRVTVQVVPISAQTSTTVDLTGTASVQALAAIANVKWAVYDWCATLVGTSAGTMAVTVHLMDGSTTRDSITFAQTATTAGEQRGDCRHYLIPIQATTSAAVNVQATASAATTTIRTVIGAGQTGT